MIECIWTVARMVVNDTYKWGDYLHTGCNIYRAYEPTKFSNYCPHCGGRIFFHILTEVNNET